MYIVCLWKSRKVVKFSFPLDLAPSSHPEIERPTQIESIEPSYNKINSFDAEIWCKVALPAFEKYLFLNTLKKFPFLAQSCTSQPSFLPN